MSSRWCKHLPALAGVLLAVAVAFPALAQTPAQNRDAEPPPDAFVREGGEVGDAGIFRPSVSGEILLEVQNDWVYDSDDKDDKINDLFATVEPTLRLGMLEGLWLELGLVLEPVEAPDPGEDRYFDDHGLYAETLSLNYDHPWFFVTAGKFTQNFGIAWDLAPGIYGTDFAEDYELSERWGLGGGLRVSGDFGTHELSAGVFFLDTTILSASVLTNRGRTERSDGGPSNTRDPTSFTIALDGEQIPAAGDFRYHLAFAYQSTELPGEADEKGFVIGLDYATSITPELEATPILEYAHFFDTGGVDGADGDYFTAGVRFGFREWQAVALFANRAVDIASARDIDDNMLEFSLGYEFDFGLGIDAGWRFMEQGGADSQTFGVLLSYQRAF